MKKVLFVDDSNIIIETLQRGFDKYKTHFQALFAQNGLEAMNILNDQPVSLVVTDIQMPVMDGLVLLAFMRERYPDMPCIILSGYGSDDIKDQVKNDILHFVDKPINVNTLAQLVISALVTEKTPKTRRITIGDLLQLIISDKKTCIFKIIPETGPLGYYYFYKGDLYNVVCGKLKGEEAVFKTLTYENAKLVFTKPPEQEGTKLVDINMAELMKKAKASSITVEMKTSKKKPAQPED